MVDEGLNDKNAYLFKCLMDNVTDFIYFKDLDSRLIMMNEAAARWQGKCTPAELIGKSDFDTYEASDAERMRKLELTVIETGKPLNGVEEHVKWSDGSYGWLSTSKMPLRNESGDIIGTFGISRDITAHKDAEMRAAIYAAEVKRYADEVKLVKDSLEDDMRMAAELQKAFFPRSYPTFMVNGCRDPVQFHHDHQAGGLIGGDFCSVRKLSDTEAGIFLCDVMGHGVRAALGTAAIRTLVDEMEVSEKDPGQFLEHMNRSLVPILHHSGEDLIFATACYMVLNLETLTLKLANAGHPIPVYLGSGGEVKWCLESFQRGPALALDAQMTYLTVQHQLAPSDGVVMFTDGIFEIARGDSEEFGEERLLDAFKRHIDEPLQDLFPSILQEARAFAGDVTFDDDVCLVGFRLN